MTRREVDEVLALCRDYELRERQLGRQVWRWRLATAAALLALVLL